MTKEEFLVKIKNKETFMLNQVSLVNIFKTMLDEVISYFEKSNGVKFYSSDNGFSKAKLYELCGINDCVVTINFISDSVSYNDYGPKLVGKFYYTHKEREKLKCGIEPCDNKDMIRIEVLMNDFCKDKSKLLFEKGFSIKDIESIWVCSYIQPENTFGRKDYRRIEKNIVEFESRDKIRDAKFCYSFLKRMLNENIALTPNEESKYWAYKYIFEDDGLDESEETWVKRFANQDVLLEYLRCSSFFRPLNELESLIFQYLCKSRLDYRLKIIDKNLQFIGGLEKYCNKYPESAEILLNLCEFFEDKRFNIVGKHLLYVNFQSYIHIFLRHVKELSNDKIYVDKTKFQLRIEDVDYVISTVMKSLNDEYQNFRESNSDRKFEKFGGKAYYYLGDYYCVIVDSFGRLETFYKEEWRKGQIVNCAWIDV